MLNEKSKLKRVLDIRVYFEGPSDGTTREYIDIIDSYLMERLPVMINNALGTYGYEASVLEDKTLCDIVGEEKPGCKHTLVIAIYTAGSSKPVFYAVYRYRKGDNTYEFFLEDILESKNI